MSKYAIKFFNQMIGNWQITRVITASDGDVIGKATGAVSITILDKEALLYSETVIASMHDIHTFKSIRDYKLTLTNGVLTKNFVEPEGDRIFYELNFAEDGNSATGEHLCSDDNYRALYNIVNNDFFSIRYDVSGPAKDYCIDTSFCRLLGEFDE